MKPAGAWEKSPAAGGSALRINSNKNTLATDVSSSKETKWECVELAQKNNYVGEP